MFHINRRQAYRRAEEVDTHSDRQTTTNRRIESAEGHPIAQEPTDYYDDNMENAKSL